jgi:hypothetical protein
MTTIPEQIETIRRAANAGLRPANCSTPVARAAAIATLKAIREPSEATLVAARDWIRARIGTSIGNDAVTDCFHTMIDVLIAEWEAHNG